MSGPFACHPGCLACADGWFGCFQLVTYTLDPVNAGQWEQQVTRPLLALQAISSRIPQRLFPICIH